MKRPAEKLSSFAAIIVYSMSNDANPSGSTPFGSKVPSRAGSPGPGSKPNSHGLLGVATANLIKVKKERTYLAGSKALDALAKLIQATESFFHPSNYGRWAPMLVSLHHRSYLLLLELIKNRLSGSIPSKRNLGILEAMERRRKNRLQDSDRMATHPRDSSRVRQDDANCRSPIDVLSRSDHDRQRSIRSQNDGSTRT